MNDTRHRWWSVNFGSRSGLMPSENKLLFAYSFTSYVAEYVPEAVVIIRHLTLAPVSSICWPRFQYTEILMAEGVTYMMDDDVMETFSALLALCARNSPVTGECPSQRPVTRIFDVFFDLCLNKWLSKNSKRRWFETPSRSLWRHFNGIISYYLAELFHKCRASIIFRG